MSIQFTEQNLDQLSRIDNLVENGLIIHDHYVKSVVKGNITHFKVDAHKQVITVETDEEETFVIVEIQKDNTTGNYTFVSTDNETFDYLVLVDNKFYDKNVEVTVATVTALL